MTHSVTGSVRILLAVAAVLAAPLPALAQGTPTPEEARKRLEADKSRLQAKEKRSKLLQADLDKLKAERGRINKMLVQTGKNIQQSEAQLGVIESRLGALQLEERRLRKQLERRHGTISALLAALQRIGRNPPPVMITRRKDALTMVRSAMLLSSAFPELRVQAVGLANRLKDLARVIKSGRTERENLAAEKRRHEAARIRLAALQDQKRRSSAQQRAELESVRQEVARIASNVKQMSDLLERLDKRVLARMPADAKPKVAILEPSDKLRVLSPGRIKPNVPFDRAQGMLQLPANGRRYLSFGEKTTYGTVSKGIGIQTRLGATVVSPCDGLIVYAGEFRTYGQLLIISPGGGYHVLLAGLSQIDVQVGQSVLLGEPVGAMTSAVKSQTAKDSGPVLTVEFRKDQRPIDPDPWWSDASRKVQG